MKEKKRSLFYRLLRAYLYSSLHIALIGGFTYYLAHYRMYNNLFESLFFGISVFIFYNFSRFVRIKNYEKIQDNPHLYWISKNFTELLFVNGFCIVFLILLHTKVEIQTFFPWFTLPLCILYLFIRKIKYLKNIIIAIVWWACIRNYEDSLNRVLFDTSIIIYFFFLSIWYDRKDLPNGKKYELYYLFGVDILMLLPFLIDRLLK